MKKCVFLILQAAFCWNLFAQDAPAETTAAPASASPQAAAQAAANGLTPELTEKRTKFEQAKRAGDCSYLYSFILEAGPLENYPLEDEKKAKENEEMRKLILESNAALRAYTIHDRTTEPYQTGKMDPQVREVPQVMMAQVFSSPEPVLPQVVAALLTRSTDRFNKTKIMHDWICDNIAYDYEMAASGKVDGQDYASVLKKKKAVCVGYANLLKKMCDIAGIEAIVIGGSLKAKDYGWTGKVPSGPHAWNGVYINNKWYLVDATLDAGMAPNLKAFVRRYSTEYLFLDSRPFLYTHFPEKPELQYFGPALNAEGFETEIAAPGRFFQYGLSFDKDAPHDTNTAVNGTYNFNMHQSKLNVNVSTEMPSGEAWVEEGKAKGAKIALAGYLLPEPPAGDYTCTVKARYSDEHDVPREIDINTFENDLMKRVTDFKNEKKINPRELIAFKSSYSKVEATGKYYYNEDPFDTNKNSAVIKVVRLLGLPTDSPNEVLKFSLKGQ